MATAPSSALTSPWAIRRASPPPSPARPNPRAVWHWLDRHITDTPDNLNNRFAVADQINAQFHQPGPFWGRPETAAHAHLSPTKAIDYAALGLTERRHVETFVPTAQPVWKLYTTGAVGSQRLMGLPLIHRLSQRPAYRRLAL